MPAKETTSLHELLRSLREERGQSLREVARHLSVDPGYLSRIERGTKPASSAMIERASVYYDVPEELLALSRGVVPPDITAILQAHPDLLKELRERYGPN
jgi:transcriptional regulator with XRE-family HTH domain